jgi:hypothetical protein
MRYERLRTGRLDRMSAAALLVAVTLGPTIVLALFFYGHI